MLVYWELFLAFLIPNIIGYGGGPAIIPLIEAEVVGRYGWMNAQQFAETLALGNALPSPIATKMAGYVGYDVAGIGGASVAILATVVPSLMLMLGALGLLYRHRDSLRVKRMSQWVRPVIAMMILSFAAPKRKWPAKKPAIFRKQYDGALPTYFKPESER